MNYLVLICLLIHSINAFDLMAGRQAEEMKAQDRINCNCSCYLRDAQDVVNGNDKIDDQLQSEATFKLNDESGYELGKIICHLVCHRGKCHMEYHRGEGQQFSSEQFQLVKSPFSETEVGEVRSENFPGICIKSVCISYCQKHGFKYARCSRWTRKCICEIRSNEF